MPYQTTFFQLPCGARAYRLQLAGTFTGEDAAALIKRQEPGGDLEGLPSLILTEELSSVTSDARGAFAGPGALSGRERWRAAVVTNPVIRVTANFVMRVQGTRRSKLFASEPEALQWLDARVREDVARTGAP